MNPPRSQTGFSRWALLGSLTLHGLLGIALLIPDSPEAQSGIDHTGRFSPILWEVEVTRSSTEDLTVVQSNDAAKQREPFDPTSVRIEEPASRPIATASGKGQTNLAHSGEPSETNPTGARPRASPEKLGSSIFPKARESKRIVFVVDRSISMGASGGILVAREEVRRALEVLPKDAQFELLLYNQKVTPIRFDRFRELLPANAESRELAERALRNMTAQGSTNHSRALLEALLYHPDCVYLVTDAAKLTRREVIEINGRNRSRSSIHIVELSRRSSETTPLLEWLAHNNRGSYRRVDVEALLKTSLAPPLR